MKNVIALFLMLFPALVTQANEKPEFTDYCKQLEHEIQGRKHGFLAGNLTYYVGGFHASWNLIEDETIGLTHPFHHDLRSRGVGKLESQIEGSEHTGIGNDFSGWEFYKDTRVLYGSAIVDGEVIKTPKPTSMLWRPDKIICLYELNGVTIREEKFITPNDAVVSVITASRPIKLSFEGHSFYHRNSVSSSANSSVIPRANVIAIREGGEVRSRPDPDRPTVVSSTTRPRSRYPSIRSQPGSGGSARHASNCGNWPTDYRTSRSRNLAVPASGARGTNPPQTDCERGELEVQRRYGTGPDTS